ncbi:hypothetical protein [Sphingosinicella sp. CPCC 101087]|uniref:hypothetical protein n=1 Tax=Sphingosinicella sp. CPCC 101087 TaxID=2497754 RepID=UPI00101C0FB6|nr:hypothetical protein [Sphingosinicella sp. CPCC 101087]
MLSTAPRITKAGLVVADPTTGALRRVIPMQINPTRLSRAFQLKTLGEQADRSEALRLTGPAVETISLEAVIDATDALENGDSLAGSSGIASHLAALELLASPESGQLLEVDRQAQRGVLEILPMQQPLTLFVWGKNRVVPVRIGELSINEEAFDPALNPIRATITLGLRVLTVDDLGFAAKGGQIFLNHLVVKEQLASRFPTAGLETLGIGALP